MFINVDGELLLSSNLDELVEGQHWLQSIMKKYVKL